MDLAINMSRLTALSQFQRQLFNSATLFLAVAAPKAFGAKPFPMAGDPPSPSFSTATTPAFTGGKATGASR